MSNIMRKEKALKNNKVHVNIDKNKGEKKYVTNRSYDIIELCEHAASGFLSRSDQLL
jgi:hypothetical protein